MRPNRPVQNQTHHQLPRVGETPALRIQTQRQLSPPEGGRYKFKIKVKTWAHGG
jgi:hypothetical protein